MAKIITPAPEDRWAQYSYEGQRYLDALANLFDMCDPCAAVTALGKSSFCISYNESPSILLQKKVKEVIEYINTSNFGKLLGFSLVYNTDFRITIERYCQKNVVPENLKHKVLQLCSYLKDPGPKNAYNNLPKFPEDKLLLFYNCYNELLALPDLISIPQGIILRPLQDVTKILNIKIQIEDITFLLNEDKIHAELNLSKKIGEGSYIGVSKLSCYKCDQDLGEKNPHRGTHGVWFNNNTEEFNSAPQPLADNNDQRLFKHNHQRKLSTDIDYESEALAQLKAKYVSIAGEVPNDMPHN